MKGARKQGLLGALSVVIVILMVIGFGMLLLKIFSVTIPSWMDLPR